MHHNMSRLQTIGIYLLMTWLVRFPMLQISSRDGRIFFLCWAATLIKYARNKKLVHISNSRSHVGTGTLELSYTPPRRNLIVTIGYYHRRYRIKCMLSIKLGDITVFTNFVVYANCEAKQKILQSTSDCLQGQMNALEPFFKKRNGKFDWSAQACRNLFLSNMTKATGI